MSKKQKIINLAKQIWKKFIFILVTGSASVFIAACYGMPAEFIGFGSWKIKVQSAEDKQPIPGLEVELFEYNRGTEYTYPSSKATTDAQGEVELNYSLYDEPVSIIYQAIITDVDGADNGGDFRTQMANKSPLDENNIYLQLK